MIEPIAGEIEVSCIICKRRIYWVLISGIDVIAYLFIHSRA